MSFLAQPEGFREIVKTAGFEVVGRHELTVFAREEFFEVSEPPVEPKLPPLGTHLLVGNHILTEVFNLKRSLFENRRVTLI